MREKEKKTGKWVVIVFLVMLVIGFTVPGFLNFGDEGQQYIEPRICQTDADCYLMCEDKPVEVLCSQNLCQQNSCTEKTHLSFNETPKNVQLAIEISGQKLNVANRSNSADMFVKIGGQDDLQVFSQNLPLSTILEKFKLKLDAQCLNTMDNQYCQNQGKKLEVFVNDKPSFAFGNYLPEDGDKIKIVYS